MKAINKKGFTLVEILIVVVILGILAAIVIPQFSEASSEARKSSVQSNLQMVRSQIELYKIQHNDKLPGEGVGAVDFFTALTTKTNQAGAAGTDYGPYVQKFPVNALNGFGDDTAEVVVVATTGARAASTDDGWCWNSADEEFYACDGETLDGAANASLDW